MRKLYHIIRYHLHSLRLKLGAEHNTFCGLPLTARLRHLRIRGGHNAIDIQSPHCHDIDIVVLGNHNRLIIEPDVYFHQGFVWLEGDHCLIHIKRGTTIEEANLSAAEDGRRVIVGEDCMLSSRIRITSTDSHSIIDLDSGERTNRAGDVVIDQHVWIGYNTCVGKGVHIGEHSVVAACSMVNKDVPPHSIAAGIPARVVRQGITWDRSRDAVRPRTLQEESPMPNDTTSAT